MVRLLLLLAVVLASTASSKKLMRLSAERVDSCLGMLAGMSSASRMDALGQAWNTVRLISHYYFHCGPHGDPMHRP